MELDLLLARHGGVVRRAALGRRVAAQRSLAQALSTGRVRDIGRGWLAAADADPAVVAARLFGASVTCVSAAALYGLSVLAQPDGAHVSVPRDRGRRAVESGVRIHREPEWTAPGDWPLAPVAEVVSRVLRCRPATEAVVITDSALNKGLVTVAELERRLTGRGGPAARRTLGRCHRNSRSVIETLARLALEDAGFAVDAGVSVSGVGEVDLVVDGRIVVECDGFAYHSGREQYREDRRRDRLLAALGFTVLRFTWEDVMADPSRVVAAVTAVWDVTTSGITATRDNAWPPALL